MKPRNRIKENIHRLQTQVPIPESTYYAITFLATDDGKIQRYWQSRFVGWSDLAKNQEIREIFFVDPIKMLQDFKDIGEQGVLINSREDLFLYLIIGGHGVIERSICERYLPDLTKPKETVRSITKGLVHAVSAPKEWFRKHLRMQGRTKTGINTDEV